MSSTTLELLAADKTVQRVLYFPDDSGLVATFAEACLEVVPHTRLVGATTAEFSRESFYTQDVWDTPVWHIVTRLKRLTHLLLPEHGVDYFSTGMGSSNERLQFPPQTMVPRLVKGCYRICCYAVRGSAEGHYVHVEVSPDLGKLKRICLVKTFGGSDEAWRIARIGHDLLAGELNIEVGIQWLHAKFGQAQELALLEGVE